MRADDRLLWRTERWFLRQGLPQLIEGYDFRQVVARMLPFLAFTALLWLDMFAAISPWTAGLIGAIVALAVWGWLTRFGRRPSPRLSTRTAVLLLAAHALIPPAMFLLAAMLGWIDVNLYLLGGLVEVSVGAGEDFTDADFRAIVLTVTATWVLLDAALIAIGYVITSNGLFALTLRALRHAGQDLRQTVRLQGRALPVVMFATLFLFFTNELWQACNRLGWARIGLLVGVFALIASLAVGVRLNQEAARIEHDFTPAGVADACRGTPLAHRATSISGLAPIPLRPRQRINVLFVLAVRQLVRAAIVGAGLFAILMVFGLVVVYPAIAQKWIDAPVAYSKLFPGQPLAMFKLAMLLAGFGGMNFMVNGMSDPDDRAEYFAPSVDELQRVLGVHAAYTELRHQAQ
ncbi:hypothetical protein AB0M47_13195 [Hamadaea sp. NPDC051192]|uniref:hypothetical protein n=1 Tax=Hamadaea sp. NPDC051192 TaxID=3154940 RepID=UPI003434BFA0